MLELQARAQRGVRDLELPLVRLGGCEPVLELVAGPSESAGERVARGGASSSRTARWTPRPRRARRRRGRLQARLRHAPRDDVRHGSRHEQRPEQVRAAALVLLRARLAVLVAADRDVLGAVVGGQLAAAQREHGRRNREQRGDRAPARRRRASTGGSRSRRRRCRASRRARAAARRAAAPPAARASPAAAARAPRQAWRARGSSGLLMREACRPLRRATTLTSPLVGADRARPGRRPVHEHAVAERHTAEPDRSVTAGRVAGARLVAAPAAGPRGRRRPSPRRP